MGWRDVEYETRFGRGRCSEIVGHPLADDRDLDSYQAPGPNRPELYTGASRVIGQFGHEYWIVGAVVTTIFETARAPRWLERTSLDMTVNPGLVEKLFDIPFKHHLQVAKNLTEPGVDMI